VNQPRSSLAVGRQVGAATETPAPSRRPTRPALISPHNRLSSKRAIRLLKGCRASLSNEKQTTPKARETRLQNCRDGRPQRSIRFGQRSVVGDRKRDHPPVWPCGFHPIPLRAAETVESSYPHYIFCERCERVRLEVLPRLRAIHISFERSCSLVDEEGPERQRKFLSSWISNPLFQRYPPIPSLDAASTAFMSPAGRIQQVQQLGSKNLLPRAARGGE